MDLNLLLIVFSFLTLIVVFAIGMNKVIFFDTEYDLYLNLVIVFFIGLLTIILSDANPVTLAQFIFFYFCIIVSSVGLLYSIFSTFAASIKANGPLIGPVIAIYKILFSFVVVMIIFGKIGEIADNKDRRTKANKAPFLAILALLRIFYAPIKKFLVNGDVVRDIRKFEL